MLGRLSTWMGDRPWPGISIRHAHFFKCEEMHCMPVLFVIDVLNLTTQITNIAESGMNELRRLNFKDRVQCTF